MKLLHFLFILFLISINTFAQNPFEQYNYKPKVATLSQGEYNEFHDQDTLVQIGSVILNTKTQEIVAFVKKDTLYSEATLEPDIVSRWLSPDPLAEKYTSLSPYNYVANNPIIFIDPDGREIIIFTNSSDNDDYVYVAGEQYTGGDKFIAQTVEALNYLFENSETATGLISGLSNDEDFDVYIKFSPNHKKKAEFNGDVNFDPEYGLEFSNGESISPAVGLAHELGHQENVRSDGYHKTTSRIRESDNQYDNKEERKVIEEVEHPIVNELNKNGANEGTRYDHKGDSKKVSCVTCND